MSQPTDTKKLKDTAGDAWPVSAETAPSAKRRVSRKQIRTINPLGMRVVVRLRPETNVTEGGLYLPEGAKQSLQESLLAEIVEVASAIDVDTDEETNVSGVPLGALVLIPKKAGVTVPWDDTLRIVDTKEVLAIVAESDIL